MPVGIGDTVPVVKDKNGDDIVISPSVVGEGDTVIVLPDQNGDDVICCNGAIGVGDTVVIGKDQNGDDVIIKPGGCLPIDLARIIIDPSHPLNEYTYEMSKDFTFENRFSFPKLNLRIDFTLRCGTLDEVVLPYNGEIPGLNWWPCGGVWVGLGSPDSYGDVSKGSWLWMLRRSPYATISDLPNTIINPAYSIYGEGYTPFMGFNIPGQPWRWCVPNLLYYYTPVNAVSNFTARYIHVHIRSNPSLYFGWGLPTSFITNIYLCDDGWVDYIGPPQQTECEKF